MSYKSSGENLKRTIFGSVNNQFLSTLQWFYGSEKSRKAITVFKGDGYVFVAELAWHLHLTLIEVKRPALSTTTDGTEKCSVQRRSLALAKKEEDLQDARGASWM